MRILKIIVVFNVDFIYRTPMSTLFEMLSMDYKFDRDDVEYLVDSSFMAATSNLLHAASGHDFADVLRRKCLRGENPSRNKWMQERLLNHKKWSISCNDGTAAANAFILRELFRAPLYGTKEWDGWVPLHEEYRSSIKFLQRRSKVVEILMHNIHSETIQEDPNARQLCFRHSVSSIQSHVYHTCRLGSSQSTKGLRRLPVGQGCRPRVNSPGRGLHAATERVACGDRPRR